MAGSVLVAFAAESIYKRQVKIIFVPTTWLVCRLRTLPLQFRIHKVLIYITEIKVASSQTGRVAALAGC